MFYAVFVSEERSQEVVGGGGGGDGGCWLGGGGDQGLKYLALLMLYLDG